MADYLPVPMSPHRLTTCSTTSDVANLPDYFDRMTSATVATTKGIVAGR